jgi:site-specific DNA-methyltransferase (adenine-specific)
VAHADAGDLLALLPAATIDLVYLDPPFGTGIARTDRSGTGYADALPSGIDGYVSWLRALLAECHRVLRPSGSLFLHLDWRAAHRARVVLDELFGEDCFRNEIVWHYGLGGGAPRDAFARKHDTILFYARSGSSIFHPERGPVTAAMDAKYAHVDEQGRRYQNAHGRRYYLQGGKRLDDVWEIPALAPTARERVGWPTQKPLALLDRIVRAVCGPDGCVLDPCCGAGTALVAAARLGLRAVGGDRSMDAVELSAARLTALPGDPQQRPILRVRDLDHQVLP